MSALARVRSQVFTQLWQEYRARVALVPAIEDVLRGQGEPWIEDHIAFRTLPGAACGAGVLQRLFELLGYVRREDLYFEDKQLQAFWMEPPHEAAVYTMLPKIFVSELIPARFSADFQATLAKYTDSLSATPLARMEHLQLQTRAGDLKAGEQLAAEILGYLAGRPWQRPTFADYQRLLQQSEYAAWTLAFGNRVNHFTVSVHLMRRFPSLQAFNKFLTEHLQVPMNLSGGLIKGTPQSGLEQSSTRATGMAVLFQEGYQELPYAYVEFAFRHPLPGQQADGQWTSYYQGFVVGNADRIFDSTNVR
ncbi:DUF1338 domain-containing protein [Anthocerotibacter panamensis]|uniref:DUF1338 domain-containing protein n=1 Tax=Anthocerotibacter panamensis TaxID=2857077 RepID=UPI001C40502E|nr:DUF1338 domain-containing protein [Anthocerotibacter panamensis]